MLKYNVRAVSRLFSDREAPRSRDYHGTRQDHSESFGSFHSQRFRAQTGLDDAFVQLGGPRLTPAAE